MLTEAQYVEQQRSLGRRIHEHDGVWWDAPYPFYSKPTFEFRAFAPGEAKPRWSRSFMGYSHQVPEPAMGNRFAEFMILEGAALRAFSMAGLRSEKRNQVRKGLKRCDVLPIPDMRKHVEEARAINIAQAERHRAHGNLGSPASHYRDRTSAWESEFMRQASLPGWERWGAFVQGQLVAYMNAVQIESVLLILYMKTHTDFMALCPTDAIYFTVLDQAARNAACRRIVNGGVDREGLNRYKEQFLFKRVPVPYFTARQALYRVARSVWTTAARIRSDGATRPSVACDTAVPHDERAVR